jgi:hypothetical protein
MWREPDGALGDGTRVRYGDGPASPAQVPGLIAGGLVPDGTRDVNSPMAPWPGPMGNLAIFMGK